MRISDWSSDVGSSDLLVDHQRDGLAELAQVPGDRLVGAGAALLHVDQKQHVIGLRKCDLRLLLGQHRERIGRIRHQTTGVDDDEGAFLQHAGAVLAITRQRSEEHTSELQSLMRISYAVFCLKKTNNKTSYK